MGVISAKDQCLAAGSRVKLLGQKLTNHPVEWHRNYLAVEILHVHPDFIRCLEEFDLVVLAVQYLDVLARFPFDALGREFGIYLHRRFVIDQITVDYSFAIAVGVNRCTEDFSGVQRGCGSQPDLVGIEVVEHAAIF